MKTEACKTYREKLGWWLDGEMEPHEMEEIRAHLDECENCRTLVENYRALGDRIRKEYGFPEPFPLPESFWKRVADSLPTEKRFHWLPGNLFPIWKSPAVVAAGMAVFLLLAGLFYLQWSSVPEEAEPTGGLPLASGDSVGAWIEETPETDLPNATTLIFRSGPDKLTMVWVISEAEPEQKLTAES